VPIERKKFTKTEKQYLRGMIHNLSLQRLTDQEIVDYLHNEKKIEIARSTATKIRNQVEQEAEDWYAENVDMTNGRLVVTSKPGPPREVHFIPFTKQNVDKILKGEHPFGPDSINITDIDKVVFYGKFDDMPGFQSFRCEGFTYEQFITPEWKQFMELATRPGGPLGKKYAPEKAGNEYYK